MVWLLLLMKVTVMATALSHAEESVQRRRLAGMPEAVVSLADISLRRLG